MILSSVLEIISIGLILPFLGILTNPELVYNHAFASSIISEFNFTSSDQLIKPLTYLFITAAIIAGIVRFWLLYLSTKVSHAIGSDISIKIYKNTLYKDYISHLNNNSSEIINGIINKTSVVIGGIVSPVLVIFSSLITMISIMIALFFIDAKVASVVFLGFGTIYLIIIFFTKKYLLKNGECIARKSTNMIKALQEGLGGIRDVLIDGSQEFYCRMYKESDIPMRRASAGNEVISMGPRYIMEAIGMSLIASIAYIMIKEEYLAIIPILGTFALGAQRLMPVMQQIYHSISRFNSSQASLIDTLKLLSEPALLAVNEQKKIAFNQEIILKNISFKYSQDSTLALENINLKIAKGSIIGLIGETGSGKSTLVNILMGLLTPASGSIQIDEVNIVKSNHHGWQKNIAHVPQNIFLSDSSIKENIAFGVNIDSINMERVEKAAKEAHLYKFVKNLEHGYDSLVGEQGVRLSGGQRQRIGIARALYKQVNVIVLDEATSALDSATEKSVMNSIYNLCSEQTIIIIAHRVSTLEKCDQIVEIENRTIKRVCKYNEINRIK